LHPFFKGNILNKKKITFFCQRLRLDQSQNDDQNTDGVGVTTHTCVWLWRSQSSTKLC